MTRKAERRGGEPKLGVGLRWPTRGEERCMEAEFSFVVDSAGFIDLATISSGRTNHPVFAAEVGKSLPGLRFRPALLDRRPVRQLVFYRRGGALPGVFRVQISPGDVRAEPVEEPAWPLTRC